MLAEIPDDIWDHLSGTERLFLDDNEITYLYIWKKKVQICLLAYRMEFT
jgi:hypothetical protein